MKFFKIIYFFFDDLVSIKKDIQHQIKDGSYKVMRILYMISDGLLLKLISKYLKIKSSNSSNFNNGYLTLNKLININPDLMYKEILKMRLTNDVVKNEKVKLTSQNNIDYKYYKSKKLVRLNINPEDLMASKVFSEFLLEEKWLSEMQEIFGLSPYIVGIGSWITLPLYKEVYDYDEIKNIVSSQMWHRDCDNLRDLKLFTYLTNVKNDEDGPFEFVKDTHKFTCFNPFKYKLGFSGMRVSNKFVQKKYKNEIISFYGNAGDSFIVDTRGLHRGKTITKENFHRIMFEIYFSTHPFGKIKKIQGPKKNWPTYDLWSEVLKNKKHYNFLFKQNTKE